MEIFILTLNLMETDPENLEKNSINKDGEQL